MTITADVFEAYLKCRTKCWLRATGEQVSGNVYAEWINSQNESYQASVTDRLILETPHGQLAISPSLEDLKAAKWRLAVNVEVHALTRCQLKGERRTHDLTQDDCSAVSSGFYRQEASSADLSSQTELETRKRSSETPSQRPLAVQCDLITNLHAVECVPPKGRSKQVQLIPIRFVFTNQVDKDERLMLAFDALALSEMLGREVSGGKIIHGDDQSKLKIKTSALTSEVQKAITNITALLAQPAPLDLVLNRHCSKCEFQARCRQIAVEKDDLSLLSSMSAKERKILRSKGIFTVTHLSYTFRPRRRPKIFRDKREKYHHSLRALAIREQKIHIVGSPELKIEGTPVYLDVEGLPDRDFYYLIGVRIGDGRAAVQHSLWADTVEDEREVWNDFLDVLATVENPVLLHFGSYEATFLTEMQARYCSPLQKNAAVAAAIEHPRNLLSAIFASVYFPTFSNGLKDIARWLGFNWSKSEASGLVSIVWRYRWEESRSDVVKQELITYNAEDCEAVARLRNQLVEFSYTDDSAKSREPLNIVHAETLPHRSRNTFKKNQFQFEQLEQINQAAYWDYQREGLVEVKPVPKENRSKG